MKNLFVFALALITFVSCQKDPEISPEPTPTTGSLSFRIHYDGAPVSGALIGISKDEAVIEESDFSIIKPTDENGSVSFELDPGEYFWQIKFPSDSQYSAIGGDPRSFIDLQLGSYELNAGDNVGGPVYITP